MSDTAAEPPQPFSTVEETLNEEESIESIDVGPQGELTPEVQAELNAQLLAATANGDVPMTYSLISRGADISYQEPNEHKTPLMAAAEGGHVDIVAMLLEEGAPWNAQDKNGYTAGEYALGGKHSELVELLLDFGVQAELLLGALERRLSHEQASTQKAAGTEYLQQRLTYDGDKLLDADGEAVMMGWETPLMLKHAEVICCKPGARVLNVGFGLGIIDSAIQSHCPGHHTIIEAHPDVYAHMLEKGWGDKPNVTVLFGRWQDVVAQGKLGEYDGIFFDTYSEYYEELREFQKLLPKILAPGGVYSFFNGLAPDNYFFHMVYGRLVQLELAALGLATQYVPLKVDELGDKVWQGVRNKYWHFEQYFLPIVKHNPKLLAGTEDEEEADKGRRDKSSGAKIGKPDQSLVDKA